MKVSVVIPCFNAEAYLNDSISSVLEQSYRDVEVIIVDDGSTDNSLGVLREFEARDSRVKVISKPNEKKPSIARNIGIRESTGEIITFLDADDVYHLDRLKIITSAFEKHPDCSVFIHDFDRMSEQGIKTNKGLIETKWQKTNMSQFFTSLSDDLYLSNRDLYNAMLESWFFICSDSIAFKRCEYDDDELYFDESLVYYEDINKWCDLVVNKQVILSRKILASYRDTPSSLMKSTLSADIAGIAFYEKHLHSSLVPLTEEQKSILNKKLIAEIRDAIFSTSNEGNVLDAINHSCHLLNKEKNIGSFFFCLKRVFVSLIRKIIK